MLGRALDELDAREILPVSHGLLEQRLVGAGEIGVDLVRDDAEVPDALLASGGRPPVAHERRPLGRRPTVDEQLTLVPLGRPASRPLIARAGVVQREQLALHVRALRPLHRAPVDSRELDTRTRAAVFTRCAYRFGRRQMSPKNETRPSSVDAPPTPGDIRSGPL